MQEPDRADKERALAAFLAGTLPAGRRGDMIEHLSSNSDARELLHMAAEALEVGRSVEPTTLIPSDLSSSPRPPQATGRARVRAGLAIEPPAPPSMAPRRTGRSQSSRGRRAGRLAAASLGLAALGLIMVQLAHPPAALLRSPLERSGPELHVSVSAHGPAISWTPVEDAFHYRLVIWDPGTATFVGRYSTSDHRLGADHPVVRELVRDVSRGRPYRLRIDAVDARNRLVRSSSAVPFTVD